MDGSATHKLHTISFKRITNLPTQVRWQKMFKAESAEKEIYGLKVIKHEIALMNKSIKYLKYEKSHKIIVRDEGLKKKLEMSPKTNFCN